MRRLPGGKEKRSPGDRRLPRAKPARKPPSAQARLPSSRRTTAQLLGTVHTPRRSNAAACANTTPRAACAIPLHASASAAPPRGAARPVPRGHASRSPRGAARVYPSACATAIKLARPGPRAAPRIFAGMRAAKRSAASAATSKIVLGALGRGKRRFSRSDVFLSANAFSPARRCVILEPSER